MARSKVNRIRNAITEEFDERRVNARESSGRPVGAKTRYDPGRYPHIAEVLAREYGMTYTQMGLVFGVSERTVESWVRLHPEFKEAVISGRDQFDRVKVENALLKRALGYQYTEKTVRKTKLKAKSPDGFTITVPGEETIITTKEVPADVKAIMFWLTNRQGDRWKMVTTVNANINSKKEVTHRNLQVTADLSKMDSAQLKALRQMVVSQNGGEVEAIEQESSEVPMLELIEKAQEIIDAEEIETEREEV